jgi:eukaryotic-like serine/threonine-protein kinase
MLLKQRVADHFGAPAREHRTPAGQPTFLVTRSRFGCPLEVRFPSPDAPDGRKIFAAELELLETLQHPKIVRVIEAGVLDTVPYYAVEDRATLSDRLERVGRRQLPLSETLRIMADTAEALAFCHERDTYHCGVTPLSIRADARGTWLDDFWISATNSTRSPNGLTSGFVLTNPVFNAPELRPGLRFNGPSDVYSLGIAILTCLIRDHLPRQDPVTGHPTDIITWPVATSDVEVALNELLQQMLASDPAARAPAERVRAVAASLQGLT